MPTKEWLKSNLAMAAEFEFLNHVLHSRVEVGTSDGHARDDAYSHTQHSHKPLLFVMSLFLLLWISFFFFSTTYGMAIRKCRVCTSQTCLNHGSEMLLAAVQQLARENVEIQSDYCLGGCCKGVVVENSTGRKAIPGIITEEAVAIDVARQLLNEIQGLDREALAEANIRLKQGKQALDPKRSETSSQLNEKEWSLSGELHEVWKIASEMKE